MYIRINLRIFVNFVNMNKEKYLNMYLMKMIYYIIYLKEFPLILENCFIELI